MLGILYDPFERTNDMKNSDYFFPVRYEYARPFVKRFLIRTAPMTNAAIFNPEFQMDIQNKFYDEMVSEEVKYPPELLGNQQAFESKLSREINYYWFYHSWAKNGRNIFHFTKELLEMFDNTDVYDVPLTSLQFPYESFYLSFADLERLYGVDTRGSEIYIDGVMVVKDMYKKDQIDLFLCSNVPGTKPDREWLTNKYAALYGDWFRINYKENQTIKEAGFIPKFLQDKKDEELTTGSRIFFTNIINLIINAICYITADHERPKPEWPSNTPRELLEKLKRSNSKNQSEQIKIQLQNSGFSKINFLGREYIGHGGELKSHHPDAHWRRGHWRNQPHGVGLTGRKLIWIKPTIVNKEKGLPEKGKIYDVT